MNPKGHSKPYIYPLIGSGSKEYDSSGTGEEEYAELCAGCEGSERNGTRTLRLLLDYVKSG